MSTATLPVDAKILCELIVASGSKEGVTAPLLEGFYLIGRDAECQIRPKSRSVSRQHCLLQLSGLGVQVMDLESTSGTKLAGERLPPKVWQVIRSGDELRLGKISFSIRFADDYEPTAEVYRAGDPSKTSDEMEALSVDVGEFLDDVAGDEASSEVDIEVSDEDLFADTVFDEVDPATTSSSLPVEGSDGIGDKADNSSVRLGQTVANASSTSQPKPQLKSPPKPIAPAKPKRDASRQKFKKKKIRTGPQISLPSLGNLMPQGGEGLKLIVAVVIMLSAIGVAAYQISGGGGTTSTRVLSTLD